MESIKKAARWCISGVLRACPPGTPEFVYRHLLVLPPVRTLTNTLLKNLLPERILLSEGTVLLNPEDPVISGALTLGVYEPYETELFRAHLKPGMHVLDLGANIGFHTIIAAGRVGAEGTVIALEPEPVNYSFLERNVQINKFNNVTLCQMAAADKEGVLTLHVSDANKGKHSLVTDHAHSGEFSTTVSVTSRRIDTLLAEQGITHIDLVKMDIEGAEPFALAGMPQLLSTSNLILFMEFSPRAIVRAGYEPARLLHDLVEKGFLIQEIQEEARAVIPIKDIGKFSSRFNGDAYANLLCVKSAS